MYEGVQSEILSTTRFDENSDLSTTYLGKVDTTRASVRSKWKKGYLHHNKGIQFESYWMVQNVRYYWIQDLANHLCLNHIICIANHFFQCLNLHPKHR